MAGPDCLTEADLRGFLLGELPERVAQTVSDHLERCADCEAAARRLDGLADPLMRSLRRALGASSGGGAPDSTCDPITQDPAPNPTAPAGEGRCVAGYTLLEELGRGGMSVVYKARQERPGRLVALKMVLAGPHTQTDRRTRFLFEAEAIGRLEHPNIVRIYEVGRHEDLPFLALEFVDGESLDRRLRTAPMPPAAAAVLMETLARAVHHAHERGVIHRDLKPANVLLAADGVPKVTDFGLAKQERPDLTATGDVLGTPSYMAPEQAAGDNAAVGPAADVYALGAILYECLTGRPPFKAATAMQTIRQVLYEEPRPPRRLRPGLPRDLETICLKCLQKEPRRRYADALGLAEDLRRFRACEPIAARRVSGLDRLGLWVRRRPTLAAVYGLAALAAVLVAGVGTAAWMWRSAEQARGRLADQEKLTEQLLGAEQKARQEADQARAGEKKAKEDLDRALYYQRVSLAHSDWADNNPARAEQLLLDCPAGLRCWEWNYVYRECHPALRVMWEADGAPRCIACSPDGSQLAGLCSDRSLRVWDAKTGQHLLSLEGQAHGLASLVYSPDGKQLAATGSGAVGVWEAQTGRLLLAIKEHGLFYAAAYSPDGSRLAVSSSAGVRVWDARTGEPLLTLDKQTVGRSRVAFSPDGKRMACSADDGTVRILDAATGKPLFSLAGHKTRAADLAYSPDGVHLASVSIDRSVRIWDEQTRQQTSLFTDESTGFIHVAYSPDGDRLAAAGEDHMLRVWDVRTGRQNLLLKGHRQGIGSLAFTPDGERLISASGDGTARVWDARTDREPSHQINWSIQLIAVDFSPDGEKIATMTVDGWLRVYAADSCEQLSAVQMRPGALAYSPDGATLALACYGDLHLLDAETCRERTVLKGHGNAVCSLVFRPDGRRLAIAHWDKTVNIWDLQTSKEIHVFDGGVGMLGLIYSPDGGRLAGASSGAVAHVWDAETWQERVALRASADFGIRRVAYSPDGRRLAGACIDGTVRVWDAETGQEVRTVKGHVDVVNDVAYSPDGRRLASASNDHTVRLWDAETGQEVLTLKGHANYVMSLRYSPDGRRLASSDLDNTLRVWDGSPPADVPDRAP